jgi:hypothetical protein
MQKNYFIYIIQVIEERSRGSISQWYGSGDPDPDPHKNFTDTQHCSAQFSKAAPFVLSDCSHIYD